MSTPIKVLGLKQLHFLHFQNFLTVKAKTKIINSAALFEKLWIAFCENVKIILTIAILNSIINTEHSDRTLIGE